MGLLQPESGLLFWMALAFGVVFVLLAKYGFPVILKSIEERKDFISTSLAEAHEARQQVAQVELPQQEVLLVVQQVAQLMAQHLQS